ncbi:hypothetical protein TrispH2_002437 [Trichoplax sp. H2]|nr:hypothetical protein TrispH2_002437 [Trichoplax sp. H2]|eukprot:RDD44909.1 hypothetical protein TrispH2_002437 [Trichoplax sp. H2]
MVFRFLLKYNMTFYVFMSSITGIALGYMIYEKKQGRPIRYPKDASANSERIIDKLGVIENLSTIVQFLNSSTKDDWNLKNYNKDKTNEKAED